VAKVCQFDIYPTPTIFSNFISSFFRLSVCQSIDPGPPSSFSSLQGPYDAIVLPGGLGGAKANAAVSKEKQI
jgi:hypothetical protein